MEPSSGSARDGRGGQEHEGSLEPRHAGLACEGGAHDGEAQGVSLHTGEDHHGEGRDVDDEDDAQDATLAGLQVLYLDEGFAAGVCHDAPQDHNTG